MEKVREVYDQHIWKELERSDAVPAEVCANISPKWAPFNMLQILFYFHNFLCMQVYLNAVGLLLRVHVHGGLDMFEDRLKILAICLKDRVS